MAGELPIGVVEGPGVDPYQAKVESTYADPPEAWRTVLGDSLLFQFGLYDDRPGAGNSLQDVGVRYFERQLELAGPCSPGRILDLGCGWGYETRLLAERFPGCPRIDAINVSDAQLAHCAAYLARRGLAARVRLHRCNARDIGLLPEPGVPYDLVVVRGVITHFPHGLYEASMRALAERVADGGTLVISDTLYATAAYRPDIPDAVDRIACGHRKTPEYFTGVLEDSGFAVEDVRVLPSNAEVTRWFLDVRANIGRAFPGGATGPLEELRVAAENLPRSLARNDVSVYSIIARRRVP
ncbi:SAM-dependent methyltransferase [Streptomyces luteireticuli]|uniref:Polyketide synthase-like methyltransferase domain-containing protein n=1 Tax=Streptomyces luteireticuli TaxID=173858 RepID=A0ABN0Z5D5_9ACTN